MQPAVVLAPGDPGPLRGRRPARLWDGVGHDPVRLLGAVPPRAARRARGTTPTSCGGCGAAHDDLERLPRPTDRWYQRLGAPRRPPSIAYFSPGVRHHRRAAAVLRRPRHPRRRPPQGRQRPRRPDHRRRPALPARLLPAVAVARGLAAGALPGPRPRRAAAHPAARAPTAPRRRSASTCPASRLARRADLGGPGRPGAAAAARLRRRGQRPGASARSPTGSTAAAASTGCSRRCCSASAASARSAPTAAITGHPAPEVFHTNEGHAGFLGLERIRELDRGRGAVDFDDGRSRRSRAGTVFTTHTPVPAGIDRFPRELVEQHFGGDSAAARRAGRPGARARRRELRRRRPDASSTWRSWACGSPSAPTASPRCTATVSREMFAGLWPGFDADEVPITSITNGVHAPTWVAREIIELAERAGGADARRATAEGWDAPSTQVARRRDLGRSSAHAARAAGRRRPAPAARSRGCSAGRAEAELGWVDERARPRRADDRLRPARAVVQAAHADAARPRAAASGLLLHPERPVQIVIAGKAHPADDGGKKLIQELVALRRRPGGAAPHRVPARLRHGDGAAALPRLRRLAEQPAAPARGVRHVGHEGRAQRRASTSRSSTAGGTSGTTATTAGRSRPPTASTTPTGATTSRPTRSTT